MLARVENSTTALDVGLRGQLPVIVLSSPYNALIFKDFFMPKL
jgi:hypothetical protein